MARTSSPGGRVGALLALIALLGVAPAAETAAGRTDPGGKVEPKQVSGTVVLSGWASERALRLSVAS